MKKNVAVRAHRKNARGRRARRKSKKITKLMPGEVVSAVDALAGTGDVRLKRERRRLMKFRDFFFFGLAGTFGFVVDTAVLYLLRGYLGPFYARIFSFLTAVFATWLMNRSITFRERRSGLSAQREFAIYLILMLAGGSINYGIYAWLIVSYQLVLQFPIIGVAVGSIAGLAVNLASSRFLLYRFSFDQNKPRPI
jgi:putative flippase GtrA